MKPLEISPRLAVLFLAANSLAGCGSSSAEQPAPTPNPADQPTPVEEPVLAPPPWSAERLSADAVPAAYLEAWQDAENRDQCALLAFDDPPPRADDIDARVRTARFGGGWGVAYDLPELRSAFGVAGTGVEPGPDTYDDWPYHRQWRDGSRVGYGPEGGNGPRQLAYLRVQGQECLYNVWSELGKDHLETLLEELRFVQPR